MFEDKNAVRRAARSFGLNEAKGALQRPAFMEAMATAAYESHITPVDAPELWDDFDKSKRGKIEGIVNDYDPTPTITVKKDGSTNARNVRVSELKQIISAGARKYGNRTFTDTLTDARQLIIKAKERGDYNGNTQDAFVAIARAQLKSESALTEDEIVRAFCPEVKPKEVSELKDVEAIVKSLKRLLEGTKTPDGKTLREPHPEVQEYHDALTVMNERLAVLQLAAPRK